MGYRLDARVDGPVADEALRAALVRADYSNDGMTRQFEPRSVLELGECKPGICEPW